MAFSLSASSRVSFEAASTAAAAAPAEEAKAGLTLKKWNLEKKIAAAAVAAMRVVLMKVDGNVARVWEK